MSKKLVVPKFSSEAEEAQWWFDNQEAMGDDLLSAMRDGTAGRGTVMKRMLAMQDNVTPEPGDIQQARTLADKKGIPYHDYLRKLIHEGLQHEITKLEQETPRTEHAEAA